MVVILTNSTLASVQPVVELISINQLIKPQYYNLHQIARIMKALVFERITDLYGDVPYFQAGLGYYDRIYEPAFDTQTVYLCRLVETSITSC